MGNTSVSHSFELAATAAREACVAIGLDLALSGTVYKAL
jgi:hypothetical protein